MLTDIEAYLMTKMRAKQEIADLLRAEGLSPQEFEEKSQRARQTWKVDSIGYSASIFHKAIGDPISECLVEGEPSSSPFHGSIQRIYRLDAWPAVLFCVNQEPRGYAWGEAFVPDPSQATPQVPAAVKVWKYVESTISAAASRIEVLDHWNHEKDLRITFQQGDQQSVYRATFDFDLLQEWQRIV